MFFHKQKQKIDLVFWVFGIISLGIIISVGVLLFMLFSKGSSSVERGDVDSPTTSESVPVVPSLTPEELMENYNKTMQELVGDIEMKDGETLDQLLSRTEDELLSVRVPQEMQDAHLNAVLSIVRLRAKVSQSPDEVREELLGLVKDLHTK